MPSSPIAARRCVALGVAGCGGGERQDADEPSGTYQVAVVEASSRPSSTWPQPERFVIAVRNTGRETRARTSP